jgi:hypothetical protein
MNFRPERNLSISKWETFLALLVPTMLSIGLVYAIISWNNIPEIIRFTNSNKIKEMSKIFFWGVYLSGCLTIAFLGYYYVLCTGRSNYYGGRSVSSNSQKNILQYRIETSCLLCELILISIWHVIAAIAPIEIQIGHIYSSNNWLYSIWISMPVVWLIHHILWTQLSDK